VYFQPTSSRVRPLGGQHDDPGFVGWPRGPCRRRGVRYVLGTGRNIRESSGARQIGIARSTAPRAPDPRRQRQRPSTEGICHSCVTATQRQFSAGMSVGEEDPLGWVTGAAQTAHRLAGAYLPLTYSYFAADSQLACSAAGRLAEAACHGCHAPSWRSNQHTAHPIGTPPGTVGGGALGQRSQSVMSSTPATVRLPRRSTRNRP
jgi:hypothetical protein